MSRGGLCPRGGCSEWTQINAGESHCADCGLGRTSVPLVAQVDPSPEAREANERVRALMDQFTGPPPPFDDAPFLPYGLDDRWTGLRWFGGSGRSDRVVTYRAHAFGDAPWDPASCAVRVETRRADMQGFGDATDRARFAG
jgi:hypothetical protein